VGCATHSPQKQTECKRDRDVRFAIVAVLAKWHSSQRKALIGFGAQHIAVTGSTGNGQDFSTGHFF